jgi:hypothetical protein
MRWTLYAIAGFLALGAILTISSVGKPRKPITGRVAAATVVIDGLIIAALLIAAAGQLP